METDITKATGVIMEMDMETVAEIIADITILAATILTIITTVGTMGIPVIIVRTMGIL